MPVIAVINRKGGSGKSTLATHLAAWLALTGRKVMLGDVDRQQSAQTWLKLRATQKLPPHAAIQGWTLDPKNVLRAPAGVTHMVLDTPGGMRGFDLARIVMSADAVLMPVCNSVFDRESAAECFAELKSLPRVATGRCKVGAIGMRLDGRTKAADVLAAWAAQLDLPFLGVLRETQVYVKCVELGLTIFDLPRNNVQADLGQWKPIFAWLDDALRQPEPELARPLDAKADGKPQNKADAAVATRAAPNNTAAPRGPTPQEGAGPVRPPPTPAARPGAAPARADAPARPVPAQILVNAPPRTVPAVPFAELAPALRPPSPVVARVERPPLGEKGQDGTLASIGELARALKAAEGRSPTVAPTQAPVAPPARPGATVQPARPAENAAAPLRPSRPVVPPGGRTPARDTAAPATAARATVQTPAHPRPAPARAGAAKPALSTRLGQLLDTLPLARFLQRNS